MEPYAYEATDREGSKRLVYANSTAYDNAVLFKHTLKPLYEGTSESN